MVNENERFNMNNVIINREVKYFDVDKIRSDFPILSTKVHGKPLCYFDNAATTQKPQIVIDKLVEFYSSMNSNVHRGVHYLSEASTKAYEDSRVKIKDFINASSEKEIIFTKGTTDSINLVAASFGRGKLKDGDEVIITGMEHHSNIVPWQLIAKEKNIKLRVVPITDEGEIIFEEFEKMINEKTKLISVVYVSNSLGTINPVKEIIKTAHGHNIPVLLDGAQAIQHLNVNVRELDCDFFAFSGHKIYGPTGIGVLYGKEVLLNEMPPYQGGGDMISKVTFEETTFNALPYKFEAGTPNIAGVIALGTAIDYIAGIGIDAISKRESELLNYATEKISAIKEVNIIGRAKKKSSVLSFVIDNIHPHDVGTFLDFEGVAVRTGHHCTQPVMDRFGIPATSRASFAFYNTKDEIDVLAGGVKKIIEVFK
jgi:cysteine desulfurase/selenocysteine lyase